MVGLVYELDRVPPPLPRSAGSRTAMSFVANTLSNPNPNPNPDPVPSPITLTLILIRVTPQAAVGEPVVWDGPGHTVHLQFHWLGHGQRRLPARLLLLLLRRVRDWPHVQDLLATDSKSNPDPKPNPKPNPNPNPSSRPPLGPSWPSLLDNKPDTHLENCLPDTIQSFPPLLRP